MRFELREMAVWGISMALYRAYIYSLYGIICIPYASACVGICAGAEAVHSKSAGARRPAGEREEEPDESETDADEEADEDSERSNLNASSSPQRLLVSLLLFII